MHIFDLKCCLCSKKVHNGLHTKLEIYCSLKAVLFFPYFLTSDKWLNKDAITITAIQHIIIHVMVSNILDTFLD